MRPFIELGKRHHLLVALGELRIGQARLEGLRVQPLTALAANAIPKSQTCAFMSVSQSRER